MTTSKFTPFIKAAVKNIATFGDTDIFPFPFEHHIFHDRPDLVEQALEDLHHNFDAELARHPPDNINTLAPVGYTGFRWATQIDPLWNAYYLSLVISLGHDIEAARISVAEKTVFSYRFVEPAIDGRIFDDSVNWTAFMEASREVAEHFPFVIICDVSDFYARIYHHRVENALKWLDSKADLVKRLVDVLQVFSGTVSYGLPVGGPASRLLAELALNSVDKLLRANGVRFCRFVDDYRIFCSSKEEAYQRLIFLSEKLFNEGLSLQKNKTRILSAKEFKEETRLILKSSEVSEEFLTDEEKLLRINIHFDPYSETRIDDYEVLKEQVSKVDIGAILGRELDKTRIDPAVTKQAISALRVVEAGQRKSILFSLLQKENIQTLGPVFARLMIVLRSLYLELDSETQDVIDSALIRLVADDSHLIKVELNLAYLIRVLQRRSTQQTEGVLTKLFKENSSALVRKEVIAAWIGWKHNHSLTDIKRRFNGSSKWERRAFIVASYYLSDEGKHWRKFNNDSFDPFEEVVRQWFSERFNRNPGAAL